ncbi:dihydroxy-acid and 6-phosphogluconate dehydratase [Periconia macrospinosa]|uniref:Dihydroxy-acid and 6-phosphogluconate dehydratase n=1 Tax=Periconia macrospinosa TaxID=97972 RepID=A0A2V1DJX3_9PLEO|nr:dihydroxy-acid and 6-phosphogluconate dehydratase [Periconia macrospinosa]
MLYAPAGVLLTINMKTLPYVGIASVWWELEGNGWKYVLLDLGKTIKKECGKLDMLAWQYNTVGVSDAVTMGNEGMRFSLPSRDLIADSLETVTFAQHHDACIAIPGCDKNMPGVTMAFTRHNRPSLMVYGGTIQAGYSQSLQRPINITTCYEMHGAYLYGKLQDYAKDKSREWDDDAVLYDVV